MKIAKGRNNTRRKAFVCNPFLFFSLSKRFATLSSFKGLRPNRVTIFRKGYFTGFVLLYFLSFSPSSSSFFFFFFFFLYHILVWRVSGYQVYAGQIWLYFQFIEHKRCSCKYCTFSYENVKFYAICCGFKVIIVATFVIASWYSSKWCSRMESKERFRRGMYHTRLISFIIV